MACDISLLKNGRIYLCVDLKRNAAVELTITMEAFGHEHKESIIQALKDAGYQPKNQMPTAIYQ